jgi:hypothetical protein
MHRHPLLEGAALSSGAVRDVLSDLLVHRRGSRPRWIQGVQGPVGSGKSRLVAGLSERLLRRGISTATLSLDDLYHPHRPDGPGRGPPGSHDVERGIRLLEAFRDGETPLLLPRFNKGAREGAGDRVEDEVVPHAEVLLFEGWFVGSPTPEAYRPLWALLDDLWVLRAPAEGQIRAWRHQAEEGRRHAGIGLDRRGVDALLDRMLGALPPRAEGAVTPSGEEADRLPATLPPPSVLLDLDGRRRVVALRTLGPAPGITPPLSAPGP